MHAAVYLADNVVYTKNGGSNLHPWILSTIPELQDLYSFQLGPTKNSAAIISATGIIEASLAARISRLLTRVNRLDDSPEADSRISVSPLRPGNKMGGVSTQYPRINL